MHSKSLRQEAQEHGLSISFEALRGAEFVLQPALARRAVILPGTPRGARARRAMGKTPNYVHALQIFHVAATLSLRQSDPGSKKSDERRGLGCLKPCILMINAWERICMMMGP